MTAAPQLLAPAGAQPATCSSEHDTSWFVTRDFACTAENVAAVRRYVTDTLIRHLAADGRTLSAADEDRVFRVVLCTSELATNSYDHSVSGTRNGMVTVSVLLDAAAIRVEVIDAGSDSVPHAKPGITDMDLAEEVESGRGLVLVKGVADDCGTYADEAGRTTWIEIYRQSRQ